MTDQLTALKELAEKVEAGKHSFIGVWNKGLPSPSETRSLGHLAIAAFSGSLDAAHSLHKAVLGDGWYYVLDSAALRIDAIVYRYPTDEDMVTHTATSTAPARAWLLAIIKAKIQELEQ